MDLRQKRQENKTEYISYKFTFLLIEWTKVHCHHVEILKKYLYQFIASFLLDLIDATHFFLVLFAYQSYSWKLTHPKPWHSPLIYTCFNSIYWFTAMMNIVRYVGINGMQPYRVASFKFHKLHFSLTSSKKVHAGSTY